MLRFVVIRGVLAWGIGTAVVFITIQVLQYHELDAPEIARSVGTFMVGGLFWGSTMWWLRGRKNGKSRRDQ